MNLMRVNEFARLCGVGPSTVSYATTRVLKDAMVGNQVDAAHPDAIDYLTNKLTKKEGVAPAVGGRAELEYTKRRADDDTVDHNLPENIQKYADWTLAQIGRQFGSDVRFVDYMRSIKLMEEIAEKQLRNAERANSLIPRELVATHILSYVETSNVKLLTDSPGTIARQVSDAVKANQPMEEIEKTVRDIISSQIRSVKNQIIKALKNVQPREA